MPSTSAKQAKFMRAVAHSPKFAKKVGVPQSVGKDFNMADKKIAGKKPATNTSKTFDDPDAERIPTKAEADKLMKPATKPVKPDPDTLGMKKFAKGGKAFRGATPKGASARNMLPSASARKATKGYANSPARRDVGAIRSNMDMGAGIKTPPQFAKGGKAMKKMDAEGKRELAFMKAKKAPKSMISAEEREEGMKKGGAMKKYAKGGGVFRSSANGIASKGKTKVKYPKMACGGMAKGGKSKGCK